MNFLVLKCLCNNCGLDMLTIVKGERDDGRWTEDQWFTCPNCEEFLEPNQVKEIVGSTDWNQLKNMWRDYNG